MRLTALAAVLACATSAAAEVPTLRIDAGVAYRYDRQTRTLLGDPERPDLKDEYGYHFCLGMSAPEAGLMGHPWLDIDWARSEGDGNRIDTVGVLYIERIPYGSPIWVGVGPGTFYTDIRIQDRQKKAWRIGGRATLGWQIWDPFYVEAGYSYSGEVMGVKTDSFDLSLGVAF